MGSNVHCDNSAPLTRAAKFVVAGGFGSGKTTFVGAASDIRPLSTEATLTRESVGVDDLAGIESKVTTTVALDFGSLDLTGDITMYLFGTPGQERFWFLWDELVTGAVGAVVLIDLRDLRKAFAALDFFEQRNIPFVIAANQFPGAATYSEEEIRSALEIEQGTPIAFCDARERASCKTVLLTLLDHAIEAQNTLTDTRW
jgi:signal recognition particle receptor subunit beta